MGKKKKKEKKKNNNNNKNKKNNQPPAINKNKAQPQGRVSVVVDGQDLR